MSAPKQYFRADAASFRNIPAELKSMAQWECWKLINGRKVPIDAHTGKPYPAGEYTSDQMGTATFAEACECFADATRPSSALDSALRAPTPTPANL